MASDSETPRKKRKPAYIVRADLYAESEDGSPTVFYGECWAAVTAKDELIANGADIEAVTTAAFRAGFQIEAQPVDA